MTNSTREDHGADQVSDVVILVHGIRDYGQWVQTAGEVLSSDYIVVTMPKYGRYSAQDFLNPFKSRRKPIERIHREFMDVQNLYPNARISVIAHSFGTYLFTRVLQKYRNIKVWRVILCGSVLPQEFDWAKIAGQIGSSDDEKRNFIINDCGDADQWPALAQSAGWRYGSAGTDGFGSIYVQDRFHSGEHGLFFKAAFMKRYWKPFIQEGALVPGEAKQAGKLGWRMSALRLFPLRWLLLLVYLLPAGVLAAVLAWWWLCPPPFNDITYQSFVAELSEARDQGAAAMDAFWKEYEGDRVKWAGIIVEVDPAESVYKIAAHPSAAAPDVAIAKFADPDEFKAFLTVGQKIKVSGVIVKGKFRPLLTDCHFLPDGH